MADDARERANATCGGIQFPEYEIEPSRGRQEVRQDAFHRPFSTCGEASRSLTGQVMRYFAGWEKYS